MVAERSVSLRSFIVI